MYVKFVSLIITLIVAELFMYGMQSPSDPMFLFVSNSPYIIIVRATLIILLNYVAFRKVFTYQLSRKLVLGLGIFLSIFGLFGLTSQFMIDTFSTYIKLCDFLMLAAIGMALTTAGLTMTAQRQRLPFKKTKFYKFQNNLALKLNEPAKQKSAF